MLEVLQTIVALCPQRCDPDTHNWTDLARILGQVRDLAAGGIETPEPDPDEEIGLSEPEGDLPGPAVIPDTPPQTPEAAALDG